jgi:glutathione S-transferase
LPDPGTAGFGTEEDLVQTLAGAVQDRDHLAGDSFTAADLLVSSYIGWYLQFQLLPALPAFTRFVELHRQRPAAARAYQLDGPIPERN